MADSTIERLGEIYTREPYAGHVLPVEPLAPGSARCDPAEGCC